jgi:acetyl esterase/lipase
LVIIWTVFGKTLFFVQKFKNRENLDFHGIFCDFGRLANAENVGFQSNNSEIAFSRPVLALVCIEFLNWVRAKSPKIPRLLYFAGDGLILHRRRVGSSHTGKDCFVRRCLVFVGALMLVAVPSLCLAQGKPAVVVERDLVYGKGGDTDLKLDLAMPKEGTGPFPAVVCIHGGAWREGNRQDLSKTIEVFAGRGYVAVTVSYRLSDVAPFPAQIEDCKAAVRWLRANAQKYKIDPERIGALGFSAGAHLACLLGTARKDDGLEGNGGNPEQSSRIQAVVSFFGPTDLTTKDWSDHVEKDILIPFLGGTIDEKPEQYRKASPVQYASKESPPFLFFHGTEDKLVGIRQSQMLAKKLRTAGVAADIVEMEGEGHGWHGSKLEMTIEQTMIFLDKQLKNERAGRP